MSGLDAPVAIAGADGCKAGWVAWAKRRGEAPQILLCPTFEALLQKLPSDAIVAVDMPIGLPDRTGRGGRGPEALVRPHLGERQSSVFSIPSRGAVYAETAPFTTPQEWYAAHSRASAVARATSDPPRAISIQAFGIFSKIREIDRLLVTRPDLHERVIESHPEAAFWRLNGEVAMSRVNPAGMVERKRLLAARGFDRELLDLAPPRGAAEDDVLDAAAVLLVAARRARGEAVPFPDRPLRDAHGLPVAIWT